MRAHMIAVFVTGTILAASSFLSDPAPAQDPPARPAVQDTSVKPIGKVITAAGSVTIEHVNAVVVQATLGNRTGEAKVGDPVYLGDIVQTGADGRLGITFTDGTAFDLSSNARMEMTEFVYDPNSNSNSTLLSLTKGTFTFVAGKIAKTGDMKVDTPVATMGIRGTTPHVEILADGSVKFYTLFEEGKSQVLQKNGAPPVTPPDAGTAKPREKLNLNICRGC
jgi:hypothetical protein